MAEPELERILSRLSWRFSIIRMTPDRTEELHSFLRRAYVDQPGAAFRDPDRAIAHWRWVDELNPPSGGEGSIGWVCLKNDRIVGYFGILPAIAHVQGQHIPICWGRDLIGAPETRGAGVGPLLISAAVRESQKPFLIAGLNEVSYSLFRRMGFLDLGKIPLYIKVYHPGRFANSFGWPGWVRQAAAMSIQVAQDLRTSRSRVRGDGVSFKVLEQFDGRFDRLWERLEPSFPCTVSRDNATMNWRYFRHPRYRYTVLVAVQDSLWKGVAVVRYGRSRGLAAGFITELLADPRDQSVITVLLREAEEFLVRSAPEPLVLIRCAVLHRAFEQALVRAGFFRIPSPLHWMMTSAVGPEALQLFTRRKDWLLNGGDSDLDAI